MSRIVQTSVFNLETAITSVPAAEPGAVVSEGATGPVRTPPNMDTSRDSQELPPVRETEKISGSSSAPRMTAFPTKGPGSHFVQEATKLVYKLFRVAGDPALSSVLFCGIDRKS